MIFSVLQHFIFIELKTFNEKHSFHWTKLFSLYLQNLCSNFWEIIGQTIKKIFLFVGRQWIIFQNCFLSTNRSKIISQKQNWSSSFSSMIWNQKFFTRSFSMFSSHDVVSLKVDQRFSTDNNLSSTENRFRYLFYQLVLNKFSDHRSTTVKRIKSCPLNKNYNWQIQILEMFDWIKGNKTSGFHRQENAAIEKQFHRKCRNSGTEFSVTGHFVAHVIDCRKIHMYSGSENSSSSLLSLHLFVNSCRRKRFRLMIFSNTLCPDRFHFLVPEFYFGWKRWTASNFQKVKIIHPPIKTCFFPQS